MAAKYKQASTSSSRVRTSTVNYPYHPLPLCLNVVQAVANHTGANSASVPLHLVAADLKTNQTSGDLRLKIISAKCYGLIEGKGSFRLTEIGRKLMFPTRDADSDKKEAMLQAVANPGAFEALLRRYDGSRLPAVELMANVLQNEFGIPPTWKLRVATFFQRSCEAAGAFEDGFLRHKAKLTKLADRSDSVNEHTGHVDDEGNGYHENGREGRDKGISRQRRDAPPARDIPDDTVVWTFPVGDKYLRVETPKELTMDAWNKLDLYLKVIKPTP